MRNDIICTDDMLRAAMELQGCTFSLYGIDDFDEAMSNIGFAPVYDDFSPFEWFTGCNLSIGDPVVYTVEEEDDFTNVYITLEFANDISKRLFKIAAEDYRAGDRERAKIRLGAVMVKVTKVEIC